MSEPLSTIAILREAVKNVPALKWAWGVLGVVAVVAIIASFQIGYRAASIGAVAIISLMILLVLFSMLSKLEASHFTRPAQILIYFIVVMFMVVCGLLLSSIFFGKPIDLRNWILGEVDPKIKPDPQDPTLTKLEKPLISPEKKQETGKLVTNPEPHLEKIPYKGPVIEKAPDVMDISAKMRCDINRLESYWIYNSNSIPSDQQVLISPRILPDVKIGSTYILAFAAKVYGTQKISSGEKNVLGYDRNGPNPNQYCGILPARTVILVDDKQIFHAADGTVQEWVHASPVN